MKISADEVRHVARLARLQLEPDEIEQLTGQLDGILSYVEALNGLDTDDVTPTTHAIAIHNAFRDDVVGQSLDQRDALANAPQDNGEAFVVPRVI